jgi:hypothetical protein
VEDPTQKQVDDSSRRELSAAEQMAFFELRSEVFEDVSDTFHLTVEQAAAYVDRSLAGEELQTLKDHLTQCETCVLAVEDLREFRNEIAPSLDYEYRPESAQATARTSGESSWRRLLRGLAKPFRAAPVPAFGGAALAIFLLAFAGWLVWRTPEREPQIASAPIPTSEPTAPPPQPDSLPKPQPATVVAQVNDGSGVVTLDQEGKLTGADDIPPRYQSLVKQALSSGRIERSAQLQGLTRASSSLMGSGNQQRDFSVLEPLGNVLLTARPTFRWSALEGATAYVVEVYDEKFASVAASPQLTDLTWTTSLPRGRVYSWQVKAIKDGQEITSPRPPAPQAKFRILDQARANELTQAKRAHASSHLTLGLLYADAGMLHEAEQEFRLLQKANPGSDVARNLLRQIQSLQR